jgi:hypothetical protein
VTATDGAGDLLPVARAAELSERHADSRWLLDGLWAHAGVGVVGGAPKCCKSWLGLDMAVSVASGTPCLGVFAASEPGPALIYLAEDTLGVVRERLAALCRHRGIAFDTLAVHVITAPSLRLDRERDQARLAATVRTLEPRLLLLDPFVRLHRIDENNAGEVAGLLAYLRELQREHDLAVTVVHHARKNGPAGAAAGTGLRGSGDFHAWGDSNLYLRRCRDQLVLTIEHRAAASPPAHTLALVSDNDGASTHLEVIGAPGVPADLGRSRRDAGHLDAAVLDALAGAPSPLSRPELRAHLRVRNEALGDALARLTAAGRVVHAADRWRAAPAVPVPPSTEERERNGSRWP